MSAADNTAPSAPLLRPGEKLYVYGTDDSTDGPVLRVGNDQRMYSRTITAAELEQIIALVEQAQVSK